MGRCSAVALAMAVGLAVACGGKAVVDSEKPLTPCEQACGELARCLHDSERCVERCEKIPRQCDGEKLAFLRCTIAAHDADCRFTSACAAEVDALHVCEGRPIDGSCSGSEGECYCEGTSSGEYTYSCVGGGCSCFTEDGFLGSCSAERECSRTAESCCAHLAALADRAG